MNELATARGGTSVDYMIGMGIGSLFWLAVITVFVVSIVRFRQTKKGSWLGAMAGTGLLLFIVVGNLVFGLIQVVMVGNDHRKSQAKLVSGRVVKSISGKISITLPEKWKRRDDLNELATIQVLNTEKDEYLVIMEMPKDEFDGDLGLFEAFALAAIEEQLYGVRMSEAKKSKLGSMDMIQRECVDRDVWYFQTVVEGTERYYKILAWADSKHQESSRNTFEQILTTLRE